MVKHKLNIQNQRTTAADNCRSDDLTGFHSLGVSCRPISDCQHKSNIRARLNLLTVIFAKQEESIY